MRPPRAAISWRSLLEGAGKNLSREIFSIAALSSPVIHSLARTIPEK